MVDDGQGMYAYVVGCHYLSYLVDSYLVIVLESLALALGRRNTAVTYWLLEDLDFSECFDFLSRLDVRSTLYTEYCRSLLT